MNQRRLSFLDRCIAELDHALRVVAARPVALDNERAPGYSEPQPVLEANERAHSARLMRVNHSGEIAAQALYRGQALVARNAAQRERLLNAAAEEQAHLAWCRQRTEDLGGRVSLFSPGWYLGSFAIGVAAGLAGDRTSLGFLAETEKQVAEHLDSHLEELPENDTTSRAIVTRMRADEVRHGDAAVAQGAADLSPVTKRLMQAASRVMTSVAYRL